MGLLTSNKMGQYLVCRTEENNFVYLKDCLDQIYKLRVTLHNIEEICSGDVLIFAAKLLDKQREGYTESLEFTVIDSSLLEKIPILDIEEYGGLNRDVNSYLLKRL